MYLETSYPVSPNDTAVYESDTIKAYTPTKCLKFAYHMYGADMGQLWLQAKTSHNSYRKLFSNNKSENRWKEFEVTLHESRVDYVVSGIF